MRVVEGGQVAQRCADALVPVVRRVVVLEGHARALARSVVRRLAVLVAVRGIDGRRRRRREDVVAPSRSPPRGRRPVFALGEATRVEGVDRGGDARVHRRGGVLADAPEDVGGEQIPGLVVEFDAREREDLAKLGVVAVPVRACRRPLRGRPSAVWGPRPRRRRRRRRRGMGTVGADRGRSRERRRRREWRDGRRTGTTRRPGRTSCERARARAASGNDAAAREKSAASSSSSGRNQASRVSCPNKR